jgi:hypothetical protein
MWILIVYANHNDLVVDVAVDIADIVVIVVDVVAVENVLPELYIDVCVYLNIPIARGKQYPVY